MNKIISRIVAAVAVLLGSMSVVTGTRVLNGWFDPGYTTFPLLIVYNIFIGLVSLVAGWLIWIKHSRALLLPAIITTGHIMVLLSLLTIFSDVVAHQSIKAMIFRSVVWVVIFLFVQKAGRQNNHKIKNKHQVLV